MVILTITYTKQNTKVDYIKAFFPTHGYLSNRNRKNRKAYLTVIAKHILKCKICSDITHAVASPY